MINQVWRCGILATAFSILSFGTECPAKQIRSVIANEHEIVAIKTAIGHSTMLEFTNRPISAVMGDQDSFKLEYVANSITIKPLVGRAKSNLFVFTEFERFYCELSTAPASDADYIVRFSANQKSYPLELDDQHMMPTSAPKSEKFVIKTINKTSSSPTGMKLVLKSLEVQKYEDGPRSVTILSFHLVPGKFIYKFNSGSIGVRQFGKFIDIESIYLDRLELDPNLPAINGKVALLAKDFNSKAPVELVFATHTARKKAGSDGVLRLSVSTSVGSGNRKEKGVK